MPISLIEILQSYALQDLNKTIHKLKFQNFQNEQLRARYANLVSALVEKQYPETFEGFLFFQKFEKLILWEPIIMLLTQFVYPPKWLYLLSDNGREKLLYIKSFIEQINKILKDGSIQVNQLEYLLENQDRIIEIAGISAIPSIKKFLIIRKIQYNAYLKQKARLESFINCFGQFSPASIHFIIYKFSSLNSKLKSLVIL